MTYKEFKTIIERLAKSQGFYSRLLKRINEIEIEPFGLRALEELASEFNNPVDVVMYFEG